MSDQLRPEDVARELAPMDLGFSAGLHGDRPETLRRLIRASLECDGEGQELEIVIASWLEAIALNPAWRGLVW